MSRYYANYPQYLGAQKCCDLRTQGPVGPAGPTGPASIGERGWTGATGYTGFTGPRGCRGETGPARPNASLIGGVVSNLNISPIMNVPQFFGPFLGSFDANPTITESFAATYIPFNCTLSQLYIQLSEPPGPGASYTFTVRKNMSEDGISVIISGSNVTGQNTSSSMIFNADDIITISCLPYNSLTVASARWSAKLENTP